MICMHEKYHLHFFKFLCCCMQTAHTRFMKIGSSEKVDAKINFLVCKQEPLPATVKRWKSAWYGHVTHYNNLSKTILQGPLEGG